MSNVTQKHQIYYMYGYVYTMMFKPLYYHISERHNYTQNGYISPVLFVFPEAVQQEVVCHLSGSVLPRYQ